MNLLNSSIPATDCQTDRPFDRPTNRLLTGLAEYLYYSFIDFQIKRLENVFSNSQYPDSSTQEQIANDFGVSVERIHVSTIF